MMEVETIEQDQEEIMVVDQHDAQQQQGNNEEQATRKATTAAAAAATVTLSKSWSMASAHVPTYTGGKVTHCHTTQGMRHLHGTTTSSDDDEQSDQEDDSERHTPFLLLPVGGDLALVDAQRGIKARTIRQGSSASLPLATNDDNDDDDGIDADAITCFALSWNDEILMTCSPNHLLRQYDLTSAPSSSSSSWKKSSQPPAPVQRTWGKSGHALPVTHMEFHVSNVFMATGSVDGTVRIWDVRGGYVTHVFRPMMASGSSSSGGGGGMHAVTALSWRQDASQLVLAIGRDNGSIVIHDLRDENATPIVLRDHVSAVTCLEWGPSDSPHLEHVFVSTGRDAVLNTWKIVKQQQQQHGKKKKKTPPTTKNVYQRIHTLPIYEQVEGMAILPSFDTKDTDLIVATAGSKGVVRLWKATSVPGHNTISNFSCLAEQPAGEAFGADRGGYMELQHISSHLKNASQDKEEEGAPILEQLIVADAEHNLSFLSLQQAAKDQPPLLSVDRTIVGHNDEILDLKLIPPRQDHPDQTSSSTTRIAVATNSAQVRLFELGNYSCDILDGHTGTVLCVDVSPCGRYLATCGKDKTMRLWHLDTQRCVAVATGHTEAVGATALSRKVGRYEVRGKAANNGGGSFAVTASNDRTLKRWNLPGSADLDKCATSVGEARKELTLRAFKSARAHEKDINIVSVAPNDSLIASGSQDKTVKLWRSTDLSLVGTLKGHKRGVWDCQFSPFDRVIATCSGDRTVKLWSLGDYSCVRTFQGHVASALRVRFLSGGLQLVSCGADGLVKLWTIRTNECEATMDGHNDKVWALDLSPDGTTLVSGGADSQIVVWKDTTQEQEDAKRETEEQNIMMEQRLGNHLRHKEYEQALEIALEMDKPRQALKVLTSVVENDVQKGQNGLSTLQRHVQSWPMNRTAQVLRYCREWNTRARNSHIAMLVLKAIVTTIPAHTLAATDGIPEILAGMTPYAERHFDRLDRLHASSYLLDFTLFSMGTLENDDDNDLEKDYAEWESKSKLVLPPKHVDGRVQVGGAAVIGFKDSDQNLDGDTDSGSDMTVGESDDSSSEDEASDDESEVQLKSKAMGIEEDDDASSSNDDETSSSSTS